MAGRRLYPGLSGCEREFSRCGRVLSDDDDDDAKRERIVRLTWKLASGFFGLRKTLIRIINSYESWCMCREQELISMLISAYITPVLMQLFCVESTDLCFILESLFKFFIASCFFVFKEPFNFHSI